MSQKKQFLLINLILGTILLFSYYNGVNQNPEIASQLWGGVPAILIPYIISSMFLGAFGYFFFTYYLAFKVEHKSLKVFKKFKFSIFNIIYILILLPSSLWMDLSINYISTQNILFWILAVAGLYTVGLSSVFLLLCLINIKPKKKSLLYRVSIIGCCFFTFHTMFLDGLLWTIFFHK
ncbi:MAG: hypothetical protein CMG61_04525 [Candidatus Marinimicrobia bacterium]|nr:hypothetical protein [Candidatus Neomarinimicrobiota bacterium]